MHSDLYRDERQFPKTHEPINGGGWWSLFFGSNQDNNAAASIPVNSGIPTLEHIALTHLNREYESYRFSVQAATTSILQAGKEFGQSSFRQALENVLSRFTTPYNQQLLTLLENRFLLKGERLVENRLPCKLYSWRVTTPSLVAFHNSATSPKLCCLCHFCKERPVKININATLYKT
jgi:hypothetical protein